MGSHVFMVWLKSKLIKLKKNLYLNWKQNLRECKHEDLKVLGIHPMMDSYIPEVETLEEILGI